MGYKSVNGDLDVTDMGWEVFPKGLRFLIERFHKNIQKKFQFMSQRMVWPVTMLSDGKIKDFKRIKFYSDHLIECIKLLEKIFL